MNVILGKPNFNSLMILIDSGTISSKILHKHMKKIKIKIPIRFFGSHKEKTLEIILQVK